MITIKKPPEAKIDEGVSGKLTCESCGKAFFCGASVGKCWCFAVEVKAETLAELRETFQRCLCGNCLNKYKLERNTLGQHKS